MKTHIYIIALFLSITFLTAVPLRADGREKKEQKKERKIQVTFIEEVPSSIKESKAGWDTQKFDKKTSAVYARAGRKPTITPTIYKIKYLSFPVNIMKGKFSDFIGNLGELLEPGKMPGSFKVEEIELFVQMTAEGGFSLIGSATVGTTGGIKIKLKRMQ